MKEGGRGGAGRDSVGQGSAGQSRSGPARARSFTENLLGDVLIMIDRVQRLLALLTEKGRFNS